MSRPSSTAVRSAFAVPRRTAATCFIACAAGLVAATTAPLAMREAPPAAHTGGFGEPTCHACHFQAPPNAGGGGLRITGMPDAWEPGTTYDLTVTLEHVDLALAGFQLAVRTADGHQAGSLASPDGEHVRITTFKGIMYAHQTWDGAHPARPGLARWTLRWTAPDAAPDPGADATILLHAAANAANDDDSPLGDFVYTTELTLPARSASGTPQPR